ASDTDAIRARGRTILCSRRIAHRRRLFLRRHALLLVKSRAPDYCDPKTHRDAPILLGQAAGRALDSERTGPLCHVARSGSVLLRSAGDSEQCRSGPDRGCARPTTGDRVPAVRHARTGEFDFARAGNAVNAASRTETFSRTLERAMRSLFISSRSASGLRRCAPGRARCRSMGFGDPALRSVSATWGPRLL